MINVKSDAPQEPTIQNIQAMLSHKEPTFTKQCQEFVNEEGICLHEDMEILRHGGMLGPRYVIILAIQTFHLQAILIYL